MGRPVPRVAGALLVAVTLLLRWPLTPRPTGTDGFHYIALVQALREAGAMEWLLHPAAWFGLYPGTTPVGHLVLTAAFEEITGLGFEGSSLLLSLAFGGSSMARVGAAQGLCCRKNLAVEEQVRFAASLSPCTLYPVLTLSLIYI